MGTSKLISLMSDIVLNTESACSNAEATSGSNSSQKNLRGTAIRSLCAGGSSIRTGEADPHPCTTSAPLAFAKQDGACLLQPASDFRVLCWNAFFEHGAGRGGEDACGINQIFQCQRDPVQRPPPFAARDFCFGSARFRHSRIGSDRDECVQHWV